MSLPVEGEVVGSGETSVAIVTLEGLLSCVFAHVSREFVGASETPVTLLPAARVRLLTCEKQQQNTLQLNFL